MIKKLFESNFPTLNIGALFQAQQAPSDENENEKNHNQESKTGNQKKQISNWGQELKDRKKRNDSLNSEARKKTYEVEVEFFKEFYNEFWDPENAEQLLSIGTDLMQAFKVLGFDRNTNVIYWFLTLDYVKTNLLKTKLINKDTFKAIYNAVADKLIADSEFTANDNSYNLLFCRDWYKRTSKEMLEYLELQNNIIKRSDSIYTKEVKNNNKRVFLSIVNTQESELEAQAKEVLSKTEGKALPSVQEPGIKLNNIELADAISKQLGFVNSSEEANKSNITKDSTAEIIGVREQQQLIKKLNTDPLKLAAIQYLSISTASKQARAVIKNPDILRVFKVETNELLLATIKIAEFMPKSKITAEVADEIIKVLVKNKK